MSAPVVWIDAQLSPALAPWLTETFGIDAYSVGRLGFRDATDREIFDAAREADVIVITKDSDFVDLLGQFGPPPKLLWVTTGNTANAPLRRALEANFRRALTLFADGAPLVELGR